MDICTGQFEAPAAEASEARGQRDLGAMARIVTH
jgi:hypothetical protein